MAVITELNQVQVGKETTFGTSVAGSAKLMGVTKCAIQPINDNLLLKDQRGSMAPGYNAVQSVIGGQANLEMDVSYEDILYLLDGLFSAATPSGTGAPYTRDYAAPTTAIATPDKRTLIYGQTGAVNTLVSGVVNQLTLSGDNTGVMKAKANLVGNRVIVGSLAALSDRSVNMAMGNHASISLDAWGGTMGATALAATAWAWELTLNPQRQVRGYLGSLTPADFHDKGWSGTLKLSLEWNATSDDQIATILTGTSVLQLQARVLYSSGSAGTLKTIQMDFAGSCLKAPELFSDRDGIVSYDLELASTYHSTFANWCKIQVKNGTATVV